VTGRREDLDAIRVRLAVREDATDPARDSGMLIYGDDATGRGATMPALSPPETIVRRVMPLGAGRSGRYRRPPGSHVTRSALTPSQCIRRTWRACSTFRQRSIPTDKPARSAIRPPSSLTTVNWHHSVDAPIATASSAIAGSASGARKTLTTSMRPGTSVSVL